jgi:hypothetical protein
MDQNENSKTETAKNAVKLTAVCIVVGYTAGCAAKGLYDLTTDWSDRIKEKRQARKAQKNN